MQVTLKSHQGFPPHSSLSRYLHLSLQLGKLYTGKGACARGESEESDLRNLGVSCGLGLVVNRIYQPRRV